jgi:starch synthase
LNLLKTGIVFADSINTVSPRYAQEIQTHPLGCGLDGVLAQRRDVLSGLVNGVDYRIWNPATDPHLAANYDAHGWQAGKAACKGMLQREMGLDERPEVPLIGFVGRLADQKGLDLLLDLLPQWASSRDAQWVLLGTGEPYYQQRLHDLAAKHPERVAARLEFCDPLAHRIQAGADIFLMPSRYEPCGLGQLFSLKYGTVPVVHATGGLADTVAEATSEALAAGTATGFFFHDYTQAACDEALAHACHTYSHDKSTWSQLVTTGMRQDWSWAQSAGKYVALYKKTIARHRQTHVG